jgi:hypothetical protein
LYKDLFLVEIGLCLLFTRQLSKPLIDKWSSIQQIYREVYELGYPSLKRKKTCKKKTVIVFTSKRKNSMKRKCGCRKIVVKKQIKRVNIPQGSLNAGNTVGSVGNVGAVGTVGAGR